MVILAHSVLSYGAPWYLAPLQLGGIGVDLFFVLSGWLLGSQLLKEQNKTNKIDISRFWLRRWFRTLPAYYAVLSMLIFQQYYGNANFEFPWSYLFFIQNFNEKLSFFSISWSLCVEEQFYLFIAPFLAIIHKTEKTQRTFLLTLLLFLPICFRTMGLFEDSYSHTLYQVDCCIMGVLLAHVSQQHSKLFNTLANISWPLSIVSLLVILSFFVLRYTDEYQSIKIDNLLLAFTFGSWVVLANKSDYWKNALYFPCANYIATRSYGMYLLHPEILTLQKKLMLNLAFPIYFLISLIGSAILAEILYRTIEMPFINMREKFRVSKANNYSITKS